MRIHSPFRDYYDNVQTQEDNGVKFVRNTIKVAKPLDGLRELFNLVPIFHRYRPEWPISTNLVGFCGKFIPFYSYPTTPGSNKREFCYTLETIKQMISTCKVKEDQSFLMWDEERYFNKKNWKNCLINLARFKGDDLFREIESPIFHLYRDNNRTVLEINPPLNKLQFQKVMDPWQAFQELEMFIGSTLAKQVDPIVPISDVLKAETHGFDRKWSFRKMGRNSK
jgi:hypothetical protein